MEQRDAAAAFDTAGKRRTPLLRRILGGPVMVPRWQSRAQNDGAACRQHWPTVLVGLGHCARARRRPRTCPHAATPTESALGAIGVVKPRAGRWRRCSRQVTTERMRRAGWVALRWCAGPSPSESPAGCPRRERRLGRLGVAARRARSTRPRSASRRRPLRGRRCLPRCRSSPTHRAR